jgi:hypothetical protein
MRGEGPHDQHGSDRGAGCVGRSQVLLDLSKTASAALTEDSRHISLQRERTTYGWFTEGFDTADLKDAKALLDELRA